MLGWHALLYLSLLVIHRTLLKGTSTKIEGEEEFEGAKDDFEDKLVLDYLRLKELALDVTPKEK